MKNLNPALYLLKTIKWQDNMLTTPLYQQHLSSQGHMVDFYGWSLPMSYGSQLAEHHAVRRHVGMFDVSHMAIVEVTGQQAYAFLRFLLANDIAKLKQTGRAQYTLMLNEQGGVLDDLIVFFAQSQRYRLIFNAANAKRNIEWVEQVAQDFHVTIAHLQDLANVAVQGPKACELVQSLQPELSEQLSNLKPFRFIESQHWLFSRTGYTGEDGLEIMLPSEQAPAFWQSLLDQGAQPCGLGARDTLRIEAGLNLYGQDMDESTLPIESNLDWVVSWQDSERHFVGRQALESSGSSISRRLVGVVLLEKGVLRSGQQALSGETVQGTVTSGTFSPTMQRGIGLIRLDQSVTINDLLTIQYRRRYMQAQVVKPPFVRQGQVLVTIK